MLNSSHTSLQLARSLAIPPPPLPIVLIANVLTPSFRLPLRGTRGGGRGGVSRCPNKCVRECSALVIRCVHELFVAQLVIHSVG